MLFPELLAPFRAARQSTWYQTALQKLESFRRADGTYRLPKEDLKERHGLSAIYGGGHMGLGEDRRRAGWLEVESTFRMVRLHKLLA